MLRVVVALLVMTALAPVAVLADGRESPPPAAMDPDYTDRVRAPMHPGNPGEVVEPLQLQTSVNPPSETMAPLNAAGVVSVAPPADVGKPKTQGRTEVEINLSLAVLLFGLVLILIQSFVVSRRRQGWDTNSTRMIGLTLVVTAGLFLITAGYSETQIAPMMGLLGTIAGYLLGKEAGHEGSRNAPAKPPR